MVEGISLWRDNRKTKDYDFQDRAIKDYIDRSGPVFNVHKYIGPYTQATDGTVTLPGETNELSIQDIVVLENRDRKYDKDVYELFGTYQLKDNAFDLSQFGIMLSGDTILVDFHLNDHVKRIGRKLMSGDVLEVVHLRDDLPLNENSDPIPKYYVVQDAFRPASGYGPTWFAHLWEVKCVPITDTQEFRDILHNEENKPDLAQEWRDTFGEQTVTGHGVSDNSGNNSSDSSSTLEKELQITRTISLDAAEQVRKRSFFIRHLYMRPANSQIKTGLINWVFDGDGVPENFTGDMIPSGVTFPQSPADGDYFVRTDYVPETLFKRTNNIWKMIDKNWRVEWKPAGEILHSYLLNNNITVVNTTDTGSFPEKQPLASVLFPPQGEFLPGKHKD